MKTHTPDPLEDNPLIALGERLPFDRIRPEHVAPAIDHLLAQSKAALAAIGAAAGPRTWANTVAAYELAAVDLDDA